MRYLLQRLFIAVSVILVVSAFVSAQAQELTTFILVRHAEKASDGTDDPDLKPEGVERAKKFAALFQNTSIDAIYSTRFKRTKSTVALLAEFKKLPVEVYESAKAETIDTWISKHKGKTVIIAGHSNTVPQIANILLGRDEFQNFPDDYYGNILVVTVLRRGEGKVVRLSY